MESLESLYNKVNNNLGKINFNDLWQGFKQIKFALYNDKECYFDGKYIPKTSEFLANTSIKFNGEYIAIWNVIEEMDIDILTSKLVHEMFHAFQYVQKWNTFPNEMEALYKYQYEYKNLSLKMKENQILIDLLDKFNGNKYNEFLNLRKNRQRLFPYQFHYEALVEDVEGSANYVECLSLSMLNKNLAVNLMNHLKKNLSNVNYYFPIRISCYYTGLLTHLVSKLACKDIYSLDLRPLSEHLIEGVELSEIDYRIDLQVKEAVNKYNSDTINMINLSIADNEIVMDDEAELLGVNIYNARCMNGYITTTYFLMFKRNDKEEVLNGNFIIKMVDEHTIEKVYKWNIK